MGYSLRSLKESDMTYGNYQQGLTNYKNYFKKDDQYLKRKTKTISIKEEDINDVNPVQ